MKLSNKLVLSFSCLTILMMILSGLSWLAVKDLNREKNFLGLAENYVSTVLKAKSEVLTAVATNNTQIINNAIKDFAAGTTVVAELSKLATMEKTKAILSTTTEETNALPKILSKIGNQFDYIRKTDDALTVIGDEIYKELTDLMEKSLNQYNTTGNADSYMRLSELDSLIMQLRQALANFQMSKSEDSYNRVHAYLNQIKTLSDTNQNNPIYGNLLENANRYAASTLPLVDAHIQLQKTITEGTEHVAKLTEIGSELSAISHEKFEKTRASAIMQIFTVGITAFVIAVILNIYISRSVLKQLGADPQELSDVATRVTNGDYDINDGKEHIGVYRNIIMMIEKLKETLQFSQSVLSSMPIPVAVFGSNNKLKYANREMMGLLEITKKMEDCIGETSGTFMYRQENFNTATCKAIASKQTGRLTLEYETHKGNHINVATIAQPLIDAHGDVTDVISVWQDITETVRQNKVIADSHQNMQNIAVELEQVATIASSASEQLSAQIELSENGAQDQADRVATTATALEEMNATVLEIARNAGTTSDSASNVRSEASAGSESMQECVKAMHEVKEESLKLQTEMGVLSEHAQAINEIMNVISDIADQTNLLALNAAIEAARAGEAGRGFAVVADEVRNLAEKTMTSTTDVGNAISAIQKSTADNTRLVVDAVEKIERVTEMVSGAGEALLGIVQLADTTADQVRAIATASEEQSATSEEITQSVDSINNIAKETTNNMQEARKAVDEVVNQTHVLSQLIEQLQAQNK